ncbi:MAG: hypothetical protein AAFO15_00235 [Pseudomonadota bacterium]
MNIDDFFSNISKYNLQKITIITYSPLLASIIKKKLLQCKTLHLPKIKTYNNWFEDDKFHIKPYISKINELLHIIKILKTTYNYNYKTAFIYGKKIQKILENYDNLNQNTIYELINIIQENNIDKYYSYRQHIEYLLKTKSENLIQIYMPEEIKYDIAAYHILKTQNAKFKNFNTDNINIYQCKTTYEEALLVIEKIQKHHGKNICCIVPSKSLLKLINIIITQKKIAVYQIFKTFNESRFFYILHLSLISLNNKNFISLLLTLKIDINYTCIKLRQSNKNYSYKEFISLLQNDTREICQKIHHDIDHINQIKFPIPFKKLFKIHLKHILDWPNIFNEYENHNIIPNIFNDIKLTINNINEYHEILKYLAENSNITYKNSSSQVFFCSPYETLAIKPDIVILTACNTKYWPQEMEEYENNEYTTHTFYHLISLPGKIFITFNESQNRSILLFPFNIQQWQYNYQKQYQTIKKLSCATPQKTKKIFYASAINTAIKDQYKFYLRYILQIYELSYGTNQHQIIGMIIHEIGHLLLNNICYKNTSRDLSFNEHNIYYNLNQLKTFSNEQLSHILSNLNAKIDSFLYTSTNTSKNNLYTSANNTKNNLYTNEILIQNIICYTIHKYKYHYSLLPRIIFLIQQLFKYYIQENIHTKKYHTEFTYTLPYRGFLFKSKIDMIINHNIFIDYKTTQSISLKNIQEGNDWQMLIPFLINHNFQLKYIILPKNQILIVKNLNKKYIYKKLDEIIDECLLIRPLTIS